MRTSFRHPNPQIPVQIVVNQPKFAMSIENSEKLTFSFFGKIDIFVGCLYMYRVVWYGEGVSVCVACGFVLRTIIFRVDNFKTIIFHFYNIYVFRGFLCIKFKHSNVDVFVFLIMFYAVILLLHL